MKRIYNFSAGPAMLPLPVLVEASQGMLEFQGSGMSILELSHRGKHYERMHQETRQLLLKIMGLASEDYSVLFMGGGATQQFAQIPLNFLKPGTVADYVLEGEWGQKAIQQAQDVPGAGRVHIAASSQALHFSTCAKDFQFTSGAVYAHITSNNTIEGTQHSEIPDLGGAPIVVDASSDFLSRELDYSRFACLYAGAQKNVGPAGVTIVVMRKSFMASGRSDIPSIFQYQAHAKSESLLNTPPAFGVYVVHLVLQWMEREGGVAKIAKRNQRKAGIIYAALDAFPDVYEPTVKEKNDRSLMNITWRLKDTAREQAFLEEAERRGMDGLKGHRSVGGFRASVYNAFPEEGCAALAELLNEFGSGCLF